MKASADLYLTVVEELHVIEHGLNDKWDRLIDERSPTDPECETIYKMAMRKRFQEKPPQILDMDPNNIHFFVRPDVSKGHTMICPNPDLARLYATQGQRPPSMEAAGKAIPSANIARANRPKSRPNTNYNNVNNNNRNNYNNYNYNHNTNNNKNTRPIKLNLNSSKYI